MARWPIGKLLPYAQNPKTHPPAHVELIAKSMARFGQAQIVLVDGDDGPNKGEIIAGHGRVLAAQSLGWDSLMVGEAVGWTDDERRAYRIADNQLGSETLAPWDMALLKPELQDLSIGGFDMGLLGFDNYQLKQFLAGQAGNAEAEAAPELSPTPIVRTGEVWLLDEHRILCGDCTKAEDVARLLGNARPHLMVTDPPYGVNYDPNWRNEEAAKGNLPYAAIRVGEVPNDNRSIWTDAWKLSPSDVFYCWHADRYASSVQASIEEAKFEIRCQIIWAKSNFAISRGDYHWSHEPCWYAVRRGKTGHWQGARDQTTLWPINLDKNVDGGHSTQKPIECMKRPIENNSAPGESVYDPFVGSGTTIIAAEMTARHCLAMEIDPGYCQVSIERWQNFTGQKAILDGDGRDFETIRAERLSSAGRLCEVDRGVLPGDPGANGQGRPAVGAEGTKGKGRRSGPSSKRVSEDVTR